MSGTPEVGNAVGFAYICDFEDGEAEVDVGTIVGSADGDIVDEVTVGIIIVGAELEEGAVGKTLGCMEGAEGGIVEVIVEMKDEI